MTMLATEPKEPVFNPFEAIIKQMVEVHNKGSEEKHDETENEAE